ncbi:hypothetical protein LTR56_007793 [Elasticomyces elasticus]|nr:hypothetical protein LTR56_007793 [Elasticomyces elasticus]KAK3667842.1 hypothetical protein LTR22_001287 [Elasticomyces elasticus]KAK4932165.1 hypothetical protein LTR49_001462 [Elasticomyces elasticus]KAK5763455.1 hypothetical protein LTS12_006426 [Elasticomyces elasticus]
MSNISASMLAYPGPHWRMHWLDGGLANLRLDVVGFLAILGEDAVRRTSRLASLSKTFWLPRLLPAPHSLLYVQRPERLDTVKADVTAVLNGSHRDYLPHIAAVLFDFEIPPYGVRCLRIQRKDDPKDAKMTTKWTAPVILVNLLGCGLSVVLFVASLVYGDGMSLIATVLLSLLSTLVGITNSWSLRLPSRRQGPSIDETVIVRWPNGSFLVVKADEEIARILFWEPDTLDYMVRSSALIPFSMPGTVVLMLSVIALANATIELQIGWASAYVLLNAAHWVAAALPRSWNWDTSAFDIDEEMVMGGTQSSSYTAAVWKAVVFTGSTVWVRLNQAVPKTAAWDLWLAKAEAHVKTREKTARSTHTDLEPAILRRATTWRRERQASPWVWSIPNEWDPTRSWWEAFHELRPAVKTDVSIEATQA